MMDPREKAARETLRRLVDFLDEEPPSDEEAQEAVASLGIDIDALAARIQARVAAHEAMLAREASAPGPQAPPEPPPETVRDPPVEETARGALPFLARKPNGRLALAAGLLGAIAAGAAAVVIEPAARDSALPEQRVELETASAVSAIEEPPAAPDAGATRSRGKSRR